MALPKYSKEKNPETRAKRYKCLIRLLKQNIGSYDLLFVKLPQGFGVETFNSSLADIVRAAKRYYDGVLDELAEKLIKDVKEIFSGGIGRTVKKQSSLTSAIRDWCDGLNPSVFEQLFENGADKCIGFFKEVTNDERTFIIRLAKLVTDLRVEDWDDKTVDQFIDRLKEYKSTAEDFSGESAAAVGDNTNAYSLTYMDESGETVTKRFDKVEQSKRGKLLMNSIIADIESMGHSISEQEKRQILMEVLKKLC